MIKKIIEEAIAQKVSIIDILSTEAGNNIYKKLGFIETENKSMRLKL